MIKIVIGTWIMINIKKIGKVWYVDLFGWKHIKWPGKKWKKVRS